ncbi:MAG: hypothetical protein ACOCSH_02915, partial [Candidatus Hadarchaeota archaeon]
MPAVDFGPKVDQEVERIETSEKLTEKDKETLFVSFYGVPSDLKENSDCRVLDAYDIETMFYPVYLRKPEQPPVIIPIKRGFADR